MLACLQCTYNSTMSHVDKTFLRVSVLPCEVLVCTFRAAGITIGRKQILFSGPMNL